MKTIILAGGKLKKLSALYKETGIEKKALLPMGGKPMIRWVADALMGSKHVDGLAIVGLKPGDFNTADYPVHYLENKGAMLDNALAGLQLIEKIAPNEEQCLLSSSDIPLITTEMVDEFVETCIDVDADIHYPLIERKIMESRFPESKRTFTRMRDGAFSGGDLFFIGRRSTKTNLELIRGLTTRRKNFLSQARLLGFVFIFRFLLGLMDITEGAKRVNEALGINGRVINYPRAEIGMDVDKLSQYLLVKSELEKV